MTQDMPAQLPASVRDRGPALSKMRHCMDVQAAAPAQRRLARFLGLSPLRPEARPLFRCARDEVGIVEALAALGAEWTVLHAVPIGSGHGDIDHSLIGPAGVITISEHAPSCSRVLVSGDQLSIAGIAGDHIRNATYEADRARAGLARIMGREIPVTPVIVLLGVEHITRGKLPASIDVIRPSELRAWIDARPPVFDADDVASVTKISVERALWQSSPREAGDTAVLEAEFAALQADMSAARRRGRRVAFAIAGAALVACAVVIPFSSTIATGISAH
jgi:hypothetical protein